MDTGWHCAAVVVLLVTLGCEAWYAYCQHAKKTFEERYRSEEGDELAIEWRVPLLDRIGVRPGEFRDVVTTPDGEGVELYVAERAVGSGAVVHSSLVRGVGRIALALFSISAFAARELSLPSFLAEMGP